MGKHVLLAVIFSCEEVDVGMWTDLLDICLGMWSWLYEGQICSQYEARPVGIGFGWAVVEVHEVCQTRNKQLNIPFLFIL